MVIVYLFMLHLEYPCSVQVHTILKDGFNLAVRDRPASLVYLIILVLYEVETISLFLMNCVFWQYFKYQEHTS